MHYRLFNPATRVEATMAAVTSADVSKAVSILKIVADTIREVKEVPEGHLYAMLMQYSCTLQNFESIVTTLVNAKLVRRQHHCLYWVEQ